MAAATGNGYELDAIAGVYIGGTSAAGGIASVAGSVIGSMMLVVIRSGLNFVLARFNLNVNATYVTYVLTGIIVVAAVLMDIVKNNKANRVRIETPAQTAKRLYREQREDIESRLDIAYSDRALSAEERKAQIDALQQEKLAAKAEYEKQKAHSADPAQ